VPTAGLSRRELVFLADILEFATREHRTVVTRLNPSRHQFDIRPVTSRLGERRVAADDRRVERSASATYIASYAVMFSRRLHAPPHPRVSRSRLG
jgi:hypothetical protein